MKDYRCGNCGQSLNVKPTAIPGAGKIVNIVDYHECLEEPLPLDIEPVEIPTISVEKQGFTETIRSLNPSAVQGSVSTLELRDRRAPEQIKSTAPDSLLGQMNSFGNSNPKGDISKEPEDEM